ncbi:MAG: TIGR03560 family F420-dependent LLM class oxidoreductase [Chloroflexi bacterium]|nr:TIGR03560 family F420-dependent LLM class oxidoreductase [Chloroflexota bacterium]
MDLGVQIEPQFGFSYGEMLAVAREAERTGLRAVWLSDHLFLNRDSQNTPCLEAWTALAALARDTSTIRLGTMVACQSYRNPALLAKIAAGVDHLSGGRLEFGIGAGWKELEYKAYGFDFPAAATRVDQLVETLEICTRMWNEERATFVGKHYRVEDALCAPKPLQHPLPIWIGGRRPRILRIAARWAQAFNWLPEGGFPTPEQVRGGMRDIDEACQAVGRDPTTLRRSAFLYAVIGEDAAAANDVVAQRGQGEDDASRVAEGAAGRDGRLARAGRGALARACLGGRRGREYHVPLRPRSRDDAPARRTGRGGRLRWWSVARW